MHNILTLIFVLMFGLTLSTSISQSGVSVQNKSPDLANPEDLRALGTGRIIEKDNSIIKSIKLLEANRYWIVYEKNSSMHDMMMESVLRIEFPESKWGSLKLEFPNNKPETRSLTR